VRTVARAARAVLAEGTVEQRSSVTHLLVRRMRDLGPELAHAAGSTIPQPTRDGR